MLAYVSRRVWWRASIGTPSRDGLSPGSDIIALPRRTSRPTFHFVTYTRVACVDGTVAQCVRPSVCNLRRSRPVQHQSAGTVRAARHGIRPTGHRATLTDVDFCPAVALSSAFNTVSSGPGRHRVQRQRRRSRGCSGRFTASEPRQGRQEGRPASRTGGRIGGCRRSSAIVRQ